MRAAGVAKIVTIHLNEDTSSRQDFLYTEAFTLLRERGVAGAILARPTASFSPPLWMHSIAGDLAQREPLPVRVEFIETSEVADALLPSLCELSTDGSIETHETTTIKAAVRVERI